MMDQNIIDKEELIYNKIIELKKGTPQDKTLAFECIGILGNESTTESLEKRLEIVEELIKGNHKFH